MSSRRKNLNIKILQNQIQNLAVQGAPANVPTNVPMNVPKSIKGGYLQAISTPVPVTSKIKKKGVPKDELINTKRLLTM